MNNEIAKLKIEDRNLFATNPRAGLPAAPPQCSWSALHAHINRAAQLQSALTDIEHCICRERDPMEAAMHMLLIAYATDHCAKLMERLGVGRP